MERESCDPRFEPFCQDVSNVEVACDGTLYLRSHIVDYQCRSKDIKNVSFIDFFVVTHQESLTRRLPGESNSTRSRPPNQQIQCCNFIFPSLAERTTKSCQRPFANAVNRTRILTLTTHTMCLYQHALGSGGVCNSSKGNIHPGHLRSRCSKKLLFTIGKPYSRYVILFLVIEVTAAGVIVTQPKQEALS
jgi:hypothetical protein